MFAMRLLGVGYQGIKLFCGAMDLFPFVSRAVYTRACQPIQTAASTVAERCMNKAAEEEQIEARQAMIFPNPNAVAVSVDGSWMKRGFSSLYGLVAVVGNDTGKVIDVVVKSLFCSFCRQWKNDVGTLEFEDVMEGHKANCYVNHRGKSGAMEATGAIELFQRSLERRNLVYKHFIGDGDSKAHKAVLNANPYGEENPVIKKECVGHVGKRMGARLRNLVKKNSALKGRSALTGKQIDKLQAYFSKAIRENSNSVEGMEKAIWATFYHRGSTDENPQHQNCPPGRSSWCGWQRAAAEGEEKDFKHKPGFSEEVLRAIKPIYDDLTKKNLLEKCVGAHTQNNNESFHALVWKIAPKTTFCGYETLQTAVAISVCVFNEGCDALMCIMKELGLTVGKYCQAEMQDRNEARIRQSERTERSRRQHLLGEDDEVTDADELVYDAGMDSD